MRRIILALVLILTLIPNVHAATVSGNVYDLSLNLAKGARVSVNTTPEQQIIAARGKYTFQIPQGTYELNAEFYENNALSSFEKRPITIKDDGSYAIDLILFPSFEEEDDITQDISLEIPETNGRENQIISLIVIIAVFFIAYLIFKKIKSQKNKEGEKTEDKKDEKLVDIEDGLNDLKKVLKIIQEEGGRTTQREIRKKIPLSEAKISLMMTQLESEGKIRKIKKGRGNIIILNK